MHDLSEVFFWALNRQCRTHPGQACTIQKEVADLVGVAKDAGTLATGLTTLTAYVRKQYGEDAALFVGALGAFGLVAFLAYRLSEVQDTRQPGFPH
ncbi:MAG: hypothetical protein LC624_08280 [Halobacteriales archaeon]|nr:hypothetical protein [Halobacteriales archaeon]